METENQGYKAINLFLSQSAVTVYLYFIIQTSGFQEQ